MSLIKSKNLLSTQLKFLRDQKPCKTAWNMRCSRLISMYVWISNASGAVTTKWCYIYIYNVHTCTMHKWKMSTYIYIEKYNEIYIIFNLYGGKPPSFMIFLAGKMSKIIHQTGLKCKWYNSDAANLTKIEQYRLERQNKSNQIKSKMLEMICNDMKC